MARASKKTEGDDTLSNIAKALRIKVRKKTFNIPRYRRMILETWETIMLFSQKDKEIDLRLVYATLRIRKEYINAAIKALEKAGRVEHNKEKKTIKVIYK